MNDTKQNVCRIPVKAEYRMIDGKPVMVSAEYAEIPAKKLLSFLLERSGILCGSEVNGIESG